MTKNKKQTAYLAPDVVLKFIAGKDKAVMKKMFTQNKYVFFTSNFSLAEALYCIKKEELDLKTLREFVMKIEMLPANVGSLIPEKYRQQKLRKLAGLK